jgi:Rrf2 family protein
MATLISREQDYALRITAHLVTRPPGDPVTIKKLAKLLHLPYSTTSKIVHRLTRRKLLVTVQGRNGGVYIPERLRDISMWEILQAMDFKLELNECSSRHSDCPLGNYCTIRRYLKDIEKEVRRLLEAGRIRDFGFREALLLGESINKR